MVHEVAARGQPGRARKAVGDLGVIVVARRTEVAGNGAGDRRLDALVAEDRARGQLDVRIAGWPWAKWLAQVGVVEEAMVDRCDEVGSTVAGHVEPPVDEVGARVILAALDTSHVVRQRVLAAEGAAFGTRRGPESPGQARERDRWARRHEQDLAGGLTAQVPVPNEPALARVVHGAKPIRAAIAIEVEQHRLDRRPTAGRAGAPRWDIR